MFAVFLAAGCSVFAQPKKLKVTLGSLGQVNAGTAAVVINTTKEKLLNNLKLSNDGGCEILNYAISILPKGGGIAGPFKASMGVVPSYIKEKIAALGDNAIVYFEDIRLMCGDNAVEIPSFTVKYEH